MGLPQFIKCEWVAQILQRTDSPHPHRKFINYESVRSKSTVIYCDMCQVSLLYRDQKVTKEGRKIEGSACAGSTYAYIHRYVLEFGGLYDFRETLGQ